MTAVAGVQAAVNNGQQQPDNRGDAPNRQCINQAAVGMANRTGWIANAKHRQGQKLVSNDTIPGSAGAGERSSFVGHRATNFIAITGGS